MATHSNHLIIITQLLKYTQCYLSELNVCINTSALVQQSVCNKMALESSTAMEERQPIQEKFGLFELA